MAMNFEQELIEALLPEPCVRTGKRSLLACHNSRKCAIETSHKSVKVKFDIAVINLCRVSVVLGNIHGINIKHLFFLYNYYVTFNFNFLYNYSVLIPRQNT